MSDTIKDIENWFDKAKPTPTDKDKLIQIACHFEEVCEHLEAMGCESTGLSQMAYELKTYTKEQPDSVITNTLNKFDKVELLDALADQIVTAVGVGKLMGFDMSGALQEVINSNNSKMVDGEFIFDENGKIAKPDTFVEPQLEQFIK